MSPTRSLNTFRFHLVLTAAGVTLGFAFVIAAALFVPLFVQLERGDLDRAAMAGIASYLLELHASYWPVIAGTIIGSAVSGLLLFRRMTAPLIRFVGIFDSVASGEIPKPVRLRRTDYLRLEAEALNAMIAALAARAEREASDLFRLDESLSDIESAELEPKPQAALAEARAAVGSLRECAARTV